MESSMTEFDSFVAQFDGEGVFKAGDGTIGVVFEKSAKKFPGKVVFKGGSCTKLEMENGGIWAYPDEAPLDGVRFSLDLDNRTVEFLVNQGRISPTNSAIITNPFSKQEFLLNLRVARNLFMHPKVTTDSAHLDPNSFQRTLVRAAIWLTPKSVEHFNAADFPELGLDKQRELQDAVRAFLDVAKDVPPDKPPTDQQFGNGQVAFTKILSLLEAYFVAPQEADRVEEAIKTVLTPMPDWALNWDYELASDESGTAAVWLTIYVDEMSFFARKFGPIASELSQKLRKALTHQKIDRWPYIRIRSGKEHKSLR